MKAPPAAPPDRPRPSLYTRLSKAIQPVISEAEAAGEEAEVMKLLALKDRLSSELRAG